MPAKRITLTGLVQGIFFRAHAQQEATHLGITGWVRNVPDGSVEIHAEGALNALMHFERWCARGPRTARVDTIESRDVPDEHHQIFEIIR